MALAFCLNKGGAWDERRLQAYTLQRLVEVYVMTGRRIHAVKLAEEAGARFRHQGIERRDFAQSVERLQAEDTLLAELLEGQTEH